MVLNYVNTLLANTEVAEAFKHREVRRDWYYRWLKRCTRLRTANVRPIEVIRAKWATAQNVEQHHLVLGDVLLETGLAVQNPHFDPEKP